MSGSLGVKWSKPSFSITAHSSTEAPETGLQLLLGRSTQQRDNSNSSENTGTGCFVVLLAKGNFFPS